MIRKLFFILALISISLSYTVLNAQGLSSKEIDALVNRAIEATPSVGIAVAVVKDGEVIHSKGYGLKNIEEKGKVDKHTLFAIASNSKAFTAAALAILVDEGKLNWKDRVIKYIPEFKMYNDYVTANFTVEDLLTHRSGLGLGAGDLMIFPDGGDFTVEDVLKSFQYQEVVSDFRTKFDYDNLLYIVAGEVIARVSGLSWIDFIQSKIMKPLGMENSVASSTQLGNNTNVAIPHDSREAGEIRPLPIYKSDLVAAAGGIYASVADLSKWMQVQLNKGKYGKDLSEELFSVEQQRQMWSPHTSLGFTTDPNPRTDQHFAAYGLGWFLADKKGKIILSHTGGLPGMVSKTIVIPELDLGVVVLTNSSPGGRAFISISEMIVDSYLEIEKKDWITELAERTSEGGQKADSVTNKVWKVVEENEASIINLENYVGIYNDPWFGQVEISMNDEKLFFTAKRSPKLNGQMFFYKATTFAIHWEYTDMNADAFAIFELNEEGKAIGIKMKGISPDIDFSFDFQDLELKRVE